MRPSILLVSLDTLRADVAYSGQFPSIERLRELGTSFARVVSSSPLTPVSHASIMSGLHPPRHGIRHLFRERLRPDVPTLAQMLSSAGYDSAAVVSSPGLNSWYGLDRGFTLYDDEIPLLPDGRDALRVSDVKVRGMALKRADLLAERTCNWLSRRQPSSRPFFLFAHFFDAHWPYEAPETFGVRVSNAYEGEVAFMDHYLGIVLDAAAALESGLHDLLIVLSSDHGEDLAGLYPNDHGGDRGHPEEEGHGCLLYDTTQLVPLVVCGPGFSGGGMVLNQVRLVDIAPTVLELAGVPCPPMDGRSLLGLARGSERGHRPAYSETFYPEELAQTDRRFRSLQALKAVRLEDRFKVIWQVAGEVAQAYDLESDPYERHPFQISGVDGLDHHPPGG